MYYICPGHPYQECTRQEYVTAWVSKLYTVKMVASSYVCQPNHSYVFRLHSDHTRGCVVAGVLQSLVKTTPPRDYPTELFIGLWPVFTKSCTCTAFVWYLLGTVTPPSHYISTILTYRSYALFLIHLSLLIAISFIIPYMFK